VLSVNTFLPPPPTYCHSARRPNSFPSATIHADTELAIYAKSEPVCVCPL